MIEIIEPLAFGLCSLRPDELWHSTPAEVAAMIRARTPPKTPAEPLTKRREIEEDMKPEEIAGQLKMMAAAYGRK